ncbi:MAG: GNAT family N-acetyltransferase [Rhodothermaceae bacterium]
MIREAVKKDCINLAALSIEVWLNTYAVSGIRTTFSRYVLSHFTEQHFTDLLEKENIKILVFEEKEHLTGYILIDKESFYEDKSNGYEIETLYVQEHFHGKGIGKKLIQEMMAKYGNNCWLSALVHNSNAISFYKHLGFKDIGEIYFELDGEKHENRVLSYNA